MRRELRAIRSARTDAGQQVRSLRLTLQGRRVAWLSTVGRVWIRVWPPPLDLRAYHLRFASDFGVPRGSTLPRQLIRWALGPRLVLGTVPFWKKAAPVIRLAASSSSPGDVDFLFPESRGACIGRFMVKPLKVESYATVRAALGIYLPLPDFELRQKGHLLVESKEMGIPLPELILAESVQAVWDCICQLAALSMATVRGPLMSPPLDVYERRRTRVPESSYGNSDIMVSNPDELVAWQTSNRVPCHGDLSVYNIIVAPKSPIAYVIIDNANIHYGPAYSI